MTEELKDKFPKADFAFVADVMSVNFKPHPYMITARHTALNDGMVLDIEGAEEKGARCGQKNCTLKYKDHKSDRVAFVKLTRDASHAEVHEWLKSCVPISEANKVDGFCFIETGFRVIEDEVNHE